MRKLEQALSAVVGTLALAVCAFGLYVIWGTFASDCPNKDVLHWDGNLRTALVLDRYQHVLDGDYGEVVFSHLRANTWPPLRSVIALLLFLAGSPNLVADVGISFVFFGLTFGALLFAALRMSGSVLAGTTAFAALVGILLHTRELNAYALASMLETQGMFFLVLCTLSLYLLYEREAVSEGNAAGPESARRPLSERGLFFSLFCSIQGLVFTKYPYAIMLFVSVVLFELIKAPSRWWHVARELFATHYRGARRLLIVAFLAVVFGLLVAGKIGYLGVNTRVTKRLIYLVSVFIFLDFNAFVYSARDRARTLFPKSLQLFYLAGVLPALLWIFVNPDRFSTVLGGQFWIGTAMLRGTLFETLGYLFQPVWPALTLLVLGVLAMKFLFLRGVGAGKAADGTAMTAWADRWGQAVRRPEVAVLLVSWLMYVAQDLFNPNKQDRHVYHLVPALLLASIMCFLAAMRAAGGGRIVPLRLGGALLLLGLGAFPIFSAGGLLASGYSRARYFCYTDVDSAIFAEARWTAAQLLPGRKYIVINYFHDIPLTAAKRNQASEMDVLLRMRAIQGGGRLFSDHRLHRKDWSGFDYLLAISPDCSLPAVRARVHRRAAATNARPKEMWQRTYPSGGVCMQQWAL